MLTSFAPSASVGGALSLFALNASKRLNEGGRIRTDESTKLLGPKPSPFGRSGTPSCFSYCLVRFKNAKMLRTGFEPVLQAFLVHSWHAPSQLFRAELERPESLTGLEDRSISHSFGLLVVLPRAITEIRTQAKSSTGSDANRYTMMAMALSLL